MNMLIQKCCRGHHVSTVTYLFIVMELGFQSDSYSISEQSSLNEVTVCVVMNRGVLERQVVVNVNVTDVTTEGNLYTSY